MRHITNPERYNAARQARIERAMALSGVRRPATDIVRVTQQQVLQMQHKRCVFCRRRNRLANWESPTSHDLRVRCLTWNWAGGRPLRAPNRPCCTHCLHVARYTLPFYPFLWEKWDFATMKI